MLQKPVIANWEGRHYEQHSHHQREWGDLLLKELNLKGDERILDLGCGNGYTTRQLADLRP
ncbi:hypothetical protein SY88_15400 [Clostridiales bacterium PH28_bin88]|nr:hypothetical protein SY88_15400 [Clostridiales bacterium PH28_bin88]